MFNKKYHSLLTVSEQTQEQDILPQIEEWMLTSNFQNLSDILNNNSYLIYKNEIMIQVSDLAVACDEMLAITHAEVSLIKNQLLFAQQNAVSL